MSFSSLISRSVLQRFNLYYSLFSLSNSSHSSILLYFYFPFYPAPLILLNSETFIFPFSCFIVQWIACSPFLIPFGYHVCRLFTALLSLTLADSFVAVHAALLTEAATNCHRGLANQEFRMPGPGTTESNHASINITQNFHSLSPSWPLQRCHILFLHQDREAKAGMHWHLSASNTHILKYFSSDWSCFYAPWDCRCSHHHIANFFLGFTLNFETKIKVTWCTS